MSKHTLKFIDGGEHPLLQDADAPPGGKGKPHGAAFIQIYAAVGEGKKQKREDAREVGLFTRNPIRVRISPKGDAGPWSLITSKRSGVRQNP